jgi:hypothetical protein
MQLGYQGWQAASVTFDDVGARQLGAQMLRHVAHDFNDEQAAGGQAALQQCLADHTCAGAQLHHHFVWLVARLRDNAPAQCGTAGNHRPHLQGIGEPAPKEQASVRNVRAKTTRFYRVCSLFHPMSPLFWGWQR